MGDEGEAYEVERLVDARPSKGGKGREFLLKWEGYDEAENTWEHESNILGEWGAASSVRTSSTAR